jgi:hypothetical protein
MNIFEKIRMDGDDEGFTPEPPRRPTHARPGSPRKKLIFALRMARGMDLWHDADPIDYEEMSAESMPLPDGRRNNGRPKCIHSQVE